MFGFLIGALFGAIGGGILAYRYRVQIEDWVEAIDE